MHVSAVHGHRKNAYFQTTLQRGDFWKRGLIVFVDDLKQSSYSSCPVSFLIAFLSVDAYCFWKTERKNLRFEKYPDMAGDKALVEINSKNKFAVFDFVLQRYFFPFFYFFVCFLFLFLVFFLWFSVHILLYFLCMSLFFFIFFLLLFFVLFCFVFFFNI